MAHIFMAGYLNRLVMLILVQLTLFKHSLLHARFFMLHSARNGIKFANVFAWSVIDDEIKCQKFQVPGCLPAIELSFGIKISRTLVVCVDFNMDAH